MSARPKTPTNKGNAPGSSGPIPKQPSTDEIPTKILGPDFTNKQQAKSAQLAQPPPTPARAKGKTAPLPENQMKAISMKTPGTTKVEMPESEMPHVKLRAMSEVHRAKTPQNLGNLAPPYDPSAARKRSAQEYVFWGCVAVMIASGIALVVWFVGR